MSVTRDVARRTREMVAAWAPEPGPDPLYILLRLLGRWRSIMLANTFVSRQGVRIWSGPFEGMEYVKEATEGALIPRLLGTYESELHPHLAAFAAEGLDAVIDIGCAEGYYAVGLARMMPGVPVYAYDIAEVARRYCTDLASKNGVLGQVRIGGEFKPEDFQNFAGQRVLVMVDTEGAEVDILRPELAPALARMNLIVETHDVYRQDALATITARFSATHDITRVDEGPKVFKAPPWLAELPPLDKLLAVWEWRQRPTPWLVMRPKSGSA